MIYGRENWKGGFLDHRLPVVLALCDLLYELRVGLRNPMMQVPCS